MAFVVTQTANGDALGAAIAGAGISYVTGSGICTGNVNAFGTYTGMLSVGTVFDPVQCGFTAADITDGAIIATGNVTTAKVDATHPQLPDRGTDFAPAGVSGDSITYQFSFIPQYPLVIWPICFGSEEYPEFVDLFNDTMSVKLDGVEIGLLPGSTTQIAINSVNDHSNVRYFCNNSAGGVVQYDGLVPLNLSMICVPGQTYTVVVNVKDVSDGRYDSAIMMGLMASTNALCDGTDLSTYYLTKFPQVTPAELAVLLAAGVAGRVYCASVLPDACTPAALTALVVSLSAGCAPSGLTGSAGSLSGGCVPAALVGSLTG